MKCESEREIFGSAGCCSGPHGEMYGDCYGEHVLCAAQILRREECPGARCVIFLFSVNKEFQVQRYSAGGSGDRDRERTKFLQVSVFLYYPAAGSARQRYSRSIRDRAAGCLRGYTCIRYQKGSINTRGGVEGFHKS